MSASEKKELIEAIVLLVVGLATWGFVYRLRIYLTEWR